MFADKKCAISKQIHWFSFQQHFLPCEYACRSAYDAVAGGCSRTSILGTWSTQTSRTWIVENSEVRLTCWIGKGSRVGKLPTRILVQWTGSESPRLWPANWLSFTFSRTNFTFTNISQLRHVIQRTVVLLDLVLVKLFRFVEVFQGDQSQAKRPVQCIRVSIQQEDEIVQGVVTFTTQKIRRGHTTKQTRPQANYQDAAESYPKKPARHFLPCTQIGTLGWCHKQWLCTGTADQCDWRFSSRLTLSFSTRVLSLRRPKYDCQ